METKLIGAIRMISLLARGAKIVPTREESTHWCSVKYWAKEEDDDDKENEYYLYVSLK